MFLKINNMNFLYGMCLGTTNVNISANEKTERVTPENSVCINALLEELSKLVFEKMKLLETKSML